MRFGRLVVLQLAGSNSNEKRLWRCVCDCGTEKVIVGASLTKGVSVSCGCFRRERMAELAGARSYFRDLAGQRFGSLMAVERAGNKGPYTAWRCDCDCGGSIVTSGRHLSQGHTKSCGCLHPGPTARCSPADLRIPGEPAPVRRLIWARDGGICHLCTRVADPLSWHLDHVIPLVARGPHCADNVAVSCSGCNVRKHVDISWDSPCFGRAAAAYARLHGRRLELDLER